MKKLFLCLFLALITASLSAQYHCKVLSSTSTTVTFRSTGYGKNSKRASANAELNAIKTLLYSGAVRTNYSCPLILERRNEVEERGVIQELYNSYYNDFIESSVIVIPFGKDSQKRRCITLDVTIRAKQLRSWLEEKGVIRKFGL